MKRISKKQLLDTIRLILSKEEKFVLADFAYQGPEGIIKYAKERKQYYDGYNKCLEEIKSVIKPLLLGE